MKIIDRFYSYALRKYRYYFWNAEKYARYLGVKIGQNCSIATKYFGSEPYLIEIGNNVQITADVRFFTHGGGWVFRTKYPNFDCFGKITIKDNVYIGNCVLIMPGVVINQNVIIGAGSVVTKSIPENSIVAGNPSRIIGNIHELEKKLLPFNLNTKGLNYENKKNYLLAINSSKFIEKASL